MRSILLATALLFQCATHAQDISGRWTTIDDGTGEKKSVVEITIVNGKASGKVVDLYDKGKLTKTCTKCTDDRKDRPILGLEVIRNMQREGDEWSSGSILDPENGKVYDCKLWVEEGVLKVRGYVVFFYRTQEWVR